jgi:hypothetical protein
MIHFWLYISFTDFLFQNDEANVPASLPLAPVTPWRAGRKRAAVAEEDEYESASSKRTRGRKPTAGHAIADVASSVRDLASAFVGSMGSTATPERKTAIQQLEDDGDLSEDDQISAFQLFRHDSSIA